MSSTPASGDLTVRGKILQTETEDLINDYERSVDARNSLWRSLPLQRAAVVTATAKRVKPQIPTIPVASIVRDPPPTPIQVETKVDIKIAISSILKSLFWITIYAAFFIIVLGCIHTLEEQNRAQLQQ